MYEIEGYCCGQQMAALYRHFEYQQGENPMYTKRTLEPRLIIIAMLFISATVPVMFATVQAQQDMKTVYTPTGPYQVGVTFRQWVDESREEIYTAELGDKKVVSVWIWYPADVEEGAKPVRYIEEPGSSWAIHALSEAIGASYADLVDYLATLDAPAYQDAPVAGAMEQYPVIVYFDPLNGLPINQGAQMQDLASHGYIVISILHAYGFDVAFGDQLSIGDASFDWSLDDWLANALPDVSFTIDQLENLNAEEQFAQRLDLEKIGLSGYSLGGSITVMATAEDSRIKATISQDGLPPSFDYTSIKQPYMIFQAEGDFEGEFTEFSGPIYLVASDQLIHLSFSDVMFWPHNLELPDNVVDGVRGTQIINAYVIAFFDQYLKEKDQTLLQGPSDDFPEVSIRSRNVDG
jgi:predicted dienelactone hydrolase